MGPPRMHRSTRGQNWHDRDFRSRGSIRSVFAVASCYDAVRLKEFLKLLLFPRLLAESLVKDSRSVIRCYTALSETKLVQQSLCFTWGERLQFPLRRAESFINAPVASVVAHRQTASRQHRCSCLSPFSLIDSSNNLLVPKNVPIQHPPVLRILMYS